VIGGQTTLNHKESLSRWPTESRHFWYHCPDGTQESGGLSRTTLLRDEAKQRPTWRKLITLILLSKWSSEEWRPQQNDSLKKEDKVHSTLRTAYHSSSQRAYTVIIVLLEVRRAEASGKQLSIVRGGQTTINLKDSLPQWPTEGWHV